MSRGIGRTHYTTMFGQAWSATTLQLGQMMGVIANEGVAYTLAYRRRGRKRQRRVHRAHGG